LTIEKVEPSSIGSPLRSSAALTWLFQSSSLRMSASVSNTRSGGQSMRVVAETRTRAG
jgi:hypothetical protein